MEQKNLIIICVVVIIILMITKCNCNNTSKENFDTGKDPAPQVDGCIPVWGANKLNQTQPYAYHMCPFGPYEAAKGLQRYDTIVSKDLCNFYAKGKRDFDPMKSGENPVSWTIGYNNYNQAMTQGGVKCRFAMDEIDYSNTNQIKHNSGQCLQANQDGSVTYENCSDDGNQKFILRSDATLYSPRFKTCVGADNWNRLRHSNDCGNHFFWFDGHNLKYYNKPGNWSACVDYQQGNVAGVGNSCNWHFKV